jgi:PAS domain S-box-containing protein
VKVSEQDGCTNRKQVLIVEDNEADKALLDRVLPEIGYCAPAYMDPVSALFSVEGHEHELAFIGLRGDSGLDLVRQLAATRHTSVFVMAEPELADSMCRRHVAGGVDYLAKPLTALDVRLAVRRHEQRRRANQRAANAERRYSRFVEDMPLLIFRLLENYSLGFMNSACRSMLGFSPEEAVQDSDWLLSRVHPDDREAVRGGLDKVMVGFGPFTTECRLVHKNGYNVHGILKTFQAVSDAESCSASPMIDCLFMDITERVQLESIMLRDEKLKTVGAISSEVAHEIRNPLVSIGGFARRLVAKAPDIPESGIILRESQRLEKLLERIRSYLDPVETFRQDCDLNEIVVETVDLIYKELESKGLRVELALEKDLPAIQSDPEVLSKIFANLIRNAYCALSPGGVIQVHTFSNGATVSAAFKNSLSDLSAMDDERMYLPFQENNFGLPLANRLIQNLGGLLSLTREDGMAVFTVSLPKTETATQEQERLL